MAINNPYIPGDPYSYDLKWIVEQVKHAIELYEPLHDEFVALQLNFDDLRDYVQNYFNNLDIDAAISAKINHMFQQGMFDPIIAQAIADSGLVQSTITDWLTANVDPVGSAVTIDSSLTIAGSAADAKATGDAITALYQVLADNGVTMVDFTGEVMDQYISSNGTLSFTNTYATLDIQVHAGDIIHLNAQGYSTNIAMIARHNADNTYTPLVISRSSVPDIYEYVAYQDMTITLSYKQNVAHYAYVAFAAAYWIQTLIDYLAEGDILHIIDFTNEVQGQYVTSAGVMTSFATFNTLTVTGIKPGQKIIFHGRGYTTNVAMIARVNGDGTYTPLVNSISSNDEIYTYVSSEHMTIILSYLRSAYHAGAIVTDPSDVAAKALENTFSFFNFFPNAGVIGDSLSSGVIYPNGVGMTVYGDSWLSYLARKNNLTSRMHYAAGSVTCYSWLNSSMLTKMLNDTALNGYFIALGTNDLNASYPLGNLSDPAGTASFVGYYKSIIEAVQGHAPHAAIFCLSLFRHGTVQDQYSQMIEDITNLYSGVYYLDYVNTSTYYTNSPSPIASSGHFTSYGYMLVASAIEQLVNECIRTNSNDFAFYGQYNSEGGQY